MIFGGEIPNDNPLKSQTQIIFTPAHRANEELLRATPPLSITKVKPTQRFSRMKNYNVTQNQAKVSQATDNPRFGNYMPTTTEIPDDLEVI